MIWHTGGDAWLIDGETVPRVLRGPELTWIDFTRWFRRDAAGNTGTQPAGVAAYAETVLLEDSDRQVTLRLGFDDWMKIWVND